MPTKDQAERIDAVNRYHELSKHHMDRYAPGPGGLDWANQPDPFRRFAQAPVLPLPLAADELDTSFRELHRPGAVAPAALDLKHLAILLEMSLGLSAWKSIGQDRWSLRCNPSSGNLHPTEAYIATPRAEGIEAGIYHYNSHDHALEQRAGITSEAWSSAFHGNILVVLSSIHWREAWKYGVRAFRYCQHDVGHALGALRYAAAALGWRAQLLTAPGDGDLARFVGLDRHEDFLRREPEQPDLALCIGPDPAHLDLSSLLQIPEDTAWSGRASRLSPQRQEWPAIDLVAAHCRKPPGLPLIWAPLPDTEELCNAPEINAADLFRRRRSAVAFDGRTGLNAADFFRLLGTLLPKPGVPPWDTLPWEPRLHPILFVHRVNGLEPGIYILIRNHSARAELRRRLARSFRWHRPLDCPNELGLYLLIAGDEAKTAAHISCHQDIAADSAFSLGMLADFRNSLEQGPWWYRYLFWEAGLLGQVLYLQAEAIGLRGTGIGCYFDDTLHGLIGLQNDDWRDLYHFTVGGPVDDARLQSHPPYAHLKGR